MRKHPNFEQKFGKLGSGFEAGGAEREEQEDPELRKQIDEITIRLRTGARD